MFLCFIYIVFLNSPTRTFNNIQKVPATTTFLQARIGIFSIGHLNFANSRHLLCRANQNTKRTVHCTHHYSEFDLTLVEALIKIASLRSDFRLLTFIFRTSSQNLKVVLLFSRPLLQILQLYLHTSKYGYT